MIRESVVVRQAQDGDLEPLNEIYNQYVRDSHSTFDRELLTMDARREWFRHYGTTGRHRVVVALSGGAVAGYACSSRFRVKDAYETSVETSVYLAPDSIGMGIGKKLYAELFKQLEGEDVHRALAGIALPNPASVALHEHFGFKKVAHFTEVGRKFDRYWDVAWFEKPLGDQA